MKVILKKGKEKSLLRKHPWVFSGAIESVQGTGVDDVVEVVDSKGGFLALGHFSRQSQIRVRVLSFKSVNSVIINRSFFQERIYQSIERRAGYLAENSGARLVFSESDLLPGLIVDSYAGHFVVQYLSAPMDAQKDLINEILLSHPLCKSLYERSDSSARSRESLGKRNGVVGNVEPPGFIEIHENNIKYLVDVQNGHKTGFYLDQRYNRELLSKYAAGRDVLNCFSYTGGFGVSAASGKAKKVTNIDSSEDSLSLAKKNFEINKINADQYSNECGDVFEILRQYKTGHRKFDLIVLDPPKFATSAGQVIRASRGYKDINRLAFELLNPAGIVFTFSCSGHIVPALFQKIVADAALDAGCDIQIIERMSQSADHPVLSSFPESEYLKGLICRLI
jgi:23S rRNA (cytosine1962-C5)-methyltransferase